MPQPLFILCPGRSFSSVVCAIIGQHPQCYGLPEIDLFLGDTLAESVAAYERSGRQGAIGLKRVLAELHGGRQTEATVDEAAAWIRRNGHLTGRQVLDHVQDLVGPRILVEKSPTNVIQPDSLRRLHAAYPEASYIQLLRHPRSRGLSQKAALEKTLRFRLSGRSMDYEAKWTDTHLMIDGFARHLPPAQLMRLRGEDVLRDLRFYLPQVCEWLDIRQDEEAIEAMLHPEASPYSCVGPRNAPFGANPGFLENPGLDMERLRAMKEPTLDAPMDWAPGQPFSETTQRLARAYGYR